MERITSSRDRSTMRERFDCLTDAYRCFLSGSCPSQRAVDVAGLILSGVCGLVPEVGALSLSAHCHDSSVELTCLSLTLVERITSRLTSRSLSPAVTLYCVEILVVLFQDLGLMSHLIHQFQTEDQIISHLAAKTVSTCVFYQLHQSGTISPVWQQKCVQVFYSSPSGPELDACLWSLTEVLKRLLKGAHQGPSYCASQSLLSPKTRLMKFVPRRVLRMQTIDRLDEIPCDILGKLLAALDSSLCALCSKFLPNERKEETQCLVDVTSSRCWGTTWCLLLDLLEVLTASSLTCGAGVCLKSQRMTHTHSSALLTTVSCSSQYFVKKRVLLLLKRALLQKAGEDWALGGSTGLRYKHFHSDMNMLAQSVLTAVTTDWLQSVQVESASFFGGTRHVGGEEGQKPNCVMLRSVSLLLLKSMELHIQTGVDSATEVYGYLQSLWGFLRRCSVQLTEVTHRCCWVSLLFGDQDDDMMEAAKALFSIFLHHRRYSGLDELAVLEAACASGCNAHCHFLLLLQSISFDHSILLDFLISTETCFLEYFVRYLKYLSADWRGFTAACGTISLPDCHLSLQQSPTASAGGDMLKVKGESDQVEFSSCVQPTGVIPPVGTTRLAAGFHLVEYDSSDQSDPENMEVSQEEPGPSACEKGRFSALDVKQELSGPPLPIRHRQYESSVYKPNSRQEGPSLPVLQSEQTSSCLTVSGQLTCGTLARAVLCLSELREVVTRLQTKKLFPYNPSSLLKLLAQVQNCSEQSHLLHFNK
ncbi:protein Lines homolog 1 isoform X2 [Anarrhichthys ocellatus]|uniref:protein Lines homolog 1 isoform X2 n=1 Tax=Anarrhichthys ocellatus TaxID=433405 RepID=UPI0012EDFC23|nr:protein Lines homolog 1 isoform X2 [Anarrhichthys ocellatus]